MKLSIEKFTSRIFPVQSDRQFAQTPADVEPPKGVSDFIDRVRARYQAKKQKDDLQEAQALEKQVAEAEKYDVILQEAVYINPKHDITDKVIKALNAAR